jgi:glycyl-tRNA synthetase
MKKDVWHASGHVESFTDPLVECKNCHARFREDMLPKSKNCPNCDKNNWTLPRMFNLMFKTHMGPIENEASETYLRPETAQGIFVNFANVVDTMRIKLPFGIAQIGKGFRNEITTGNFLFRVREFEMMELEYFTYPKQAEADFDYWKKERMNWYLNLGLKRENLRFREHKDTERAHYAVRSVDIEYNWPFMEWGEMEGIANRTDYDLRQHAKESGKDLFYFDEEKKEKIVPYVIEPSAGVGRVMLALLVDAYYEDGERVVLKLNPRLAPIKVAVFPLLANKPDLVRKARAIYQDLKSHIEGLVVWDDRGNIGKRYYAQDEIGTPFCITVDFQTLEDDTVTIRDRDTTKQQRIKTQNLIEHFKTKLEND